MQIHELNQSQQINEIDFVGPGSIFDVGKQVLKNPAAFTSSSALGAAQQAAAQSSAQSSAQKLAKQGYTVGGSVKPQTTVTQQLQANASNPAVQQQVKQLATQWVKISGAKRAQPVTEASVTAFDPNMLSAEYKSMYDRIKTSNDLEKKATAIKASFRAWSDPLLKAGSIDMDDVRQNAETARLLDSAMTNVALVSASGAETKMEQQAAEKYMSLAIAALQTAYQNSAQQQQVARSIAGGAGAATGDDDYTQQVLKQLEPLGITKTALGSLKRLMSDSARGSTTINNTGNPMLNAIARLAGMTIR